MGRGGADGGGELVRGAEAGGCEGKAGGAQAGAALSMLLQLHSRWAHVN